jgi:class 3 adenylate cyclase/sugar lactone lactonase YvrE
MSRRSGSGRLVAVLFTDIVSSTEAATELGDARWLELLARHHRIIRANLKRFHGREQDTAGDGFFATFANPSDAIRAAASAQEQVRELGIEIRAGVTFGDVEMVDGKPGGLVVHAGARVMAEATAGRVVVSSSVRDLLPGAGFGFEDAGLHSLKGIDGDVRLYRVMSIDDQPVTAPEPDPDVARQRRDGVGRPAGGRGRAPLVVGGVIGGLVLLAVALVAASRDGPGQTGTTAKGPVTNAVVGLDPESGQPNALAAKVVPVRSLSVFNFSTHPGAAGEGRVWLPRAPSLINVDPEGGTATPVTMPISVPGADLSVGIGFGRVWVGVGHEVFTVDTGGLSTTVFARVAAREDLVADLAIGGGAVWVATRDGLLSRLDPREPENVRTVQAPAAIDGLTAGASGVWTFDVFASTVTRFDPSSMASDAPIAGPESIRSIALAGGRVWVLDDAGTVSEIQEDGTGDTARVGSSPTVMAAGFDALWVGDEDGYVYRIDPLTAEDGAVVFRAGGPIKALMPDAETGILWIDVGPAES